MYYNLEKILKYKDKKFIFKLTKVKNKKINKKGNKQKGYSYKYIIIDEV